MPDETHCYLGTVQTFSPTGSSLGEARAVVRRTLQPATSTIIEEVVLDDRQRPPAREFVTTYFVNGNHFRLKEQSQAFEGEGEFKGENWKWESWTSHVRLPDSNTVESSDELTFEGMTSEKRVLSPNDKLLIRINEFYKSIALSECEDKRKELRAAGNNP
jgi:hypothetical protein